jgi:hypothetical protein
MNNKNTSKPKDEHPCAGCRYYGRLNGHGSPMCSHPDIKPPCIAALLPPNARHHLCNGCVPRSQA